MLGSDTPWCIRLARTIHLCSSHYTLPGGSVGQKHVDLLVDEVNYLATGNYPSERVLVCGSVIYSMINQWRRVLIFVACLRDELLFGNKVILIYCFRRQRDVIGPFGKLGFVHQVRMLLFKCSLGWSFRGNWRLQFAGLLKELGVLFFGCAAFKAPWSMYTCISFDFPLWYVASVWRLGDYWLPRAAICSSDLGWCWLQWLWCLSLAGCFVVIWCS